MCKTLYGLRLDHELAEGFTVGGARQHRPNRAFEDLRVANSDRCHHDDGKQTTEHLLLPLGFGLDCFSNLLRDTFYGGTAIDSRVLVLSVPLFTP